MPEAAVLTNFRRLRKDFSLSCKKSWSRSRSTGLEVAGLRKAAIMPAAFGVEESIPKVIAKYILRVSPSQEDAANDLCIKLFAEGWRANVRVRVGLL